MGGFEIAAKMTALEAYSLYPEQRLRARDDGQLTGNIIVDSNGMQHQLDSHNSFDHRTMNYVVGRNPLALTTDQEIAQGRAETLEALQEILGKKGTTPFKVVGHYGSRLSEAQVTKLRDWLESIKVANKS